MLRVNYPPRVTAYPGADAPHVVSYPGFTQDVRRTFPNRQAAQQWARTVGVFDRAVIRPIL